jgi:tRNA pseudouridine38-40 synthase
VGRGKISVDQVLKLREKGERTSEWTTMPAKGLTLISVEYPSDDELAQRARDTRARRGSTSD